VIQPINNLPSNVLGFEAVGDITADDYREILDPAIEAAASGGHKLRALFVLGPRFGGFSGGSMLEDTRMGLKSWSAWERIAIVTDRQSITDAMHLFGWMVPGELRTFPVDRLGEATTWVVES
jgi:hypothetical protein